VKLTTGNVWGKEKDGGGGGGQAVGSTLGSGFDLLPVAGKGGGIEAPVVTCPELTVVHRA